MKTESEHEGQYLDITGEWRPDNPKTHGSGIITCRPQPGPCDGACQDCFFQGGRYYEDIETPHIPDPDWVRENGLVVRMNDGNDSNHNRDLVIGTSRLYDDVFFNTRIPKTAFPGPVILTVNGDHTDDAAWLVADIDNLMAIRFRLNTWNTGFAEDVVDYYHRGLGVPVLLTFMAYYNETVRQPDSYEWKQRTVNSYWVIKKEARAHVEGLLGVNGNLIRTCTTRDSHACKDCGNCLALYRRWRAAE